MSSPPVALVAEGSILGNRIARKVLGSLGFAEVIDADDGAELLAAFGERQPDLVLMSWQQAVVGAAEAIGLMRDPERSHRPDLPVVVTMAQPTPSGVQSVLKLGVSAIVAKPYSTRSLRQHLAAVLTKPSGG